MRSLEMCLATIGLREGHDCRFFPTRSPKSRSLPLTLTHCQLDLKLALVITWSAGTGLSFRAQSPRGLGDSSFCI